MVGFGKTFSFPLSSICFSWNFYFRQFEILWIFMNISNNFIFYWYLFLIIKFIYIDLLIFCLIQFCGILKMRILITHHRSFYRKLSETTRFNIKIKNIKKTLLNDHIERFLHYLRNIDYMCKNKKLLIGLFYYTTLHTFWASKLNFDVIYWLFLHFARNVDYLLYFLVYDNFCGTAA